MPGLHTIFLVCAVCSVLVCLGTLMGALSKSQTDKPAAKKMGITGFTFFLLAGVSYGLTKVFVDHPISLPAGKGNKANSAVGTSKE